MDEIYLGSRRACWRQTGEREAERPHGSGHRRFERYENWFFVLNYNAYFCYKFYLL
jgi:hypothetical protein